MFIGNRILNIENIFAQTDPEVIEQQFTANPLRPYGKNNLKRAKAARYNYYIAQGRNKQIGEDAYLGFEQNLRKAFSEWVPKTTAARFTMYTEQGYIESYSLDVKDDSKRILYAALAVIAYILLFLGSCSPLFCRSVVALVGSLSIVLSFIAGCGILFYCGQSLSDFHSTLPFMIMSIGLEHLFIMTDAIDQTSLDNSAYARVHEALSQAGPLLTVSTLTTALAFAFGMISSLEALSSFCLFATVCLITLYFNIMTIFLAAIVWDTQRIKDRRRDCFGLCVCKETSLFCCRGLFVSRSQHLYQKCSSSAIADESAAKSTPALPESKSLRRALSHFISQKSCVERCCGKVMAPILLTNVGRVVVLVLYIAALGASAFGVQSLQIYLSQLLFVSKSSELSQWFDANEKYYTQGTWVPTTIFVETQAAKVNSLQI